MPAPHIILGLYDLTDNFFEDKTINDKKVKEAYLQKVHAFPPEQYPEKFRKIHEAYELLKDEKSRLSYALFYAEELDTNEILSTLFLDQSLTVPDEKQFLAALRESLQP